MSVIHPPGIERLLAKVAETKAKEENAKLEGYVAKRRAAQTFIEKGYTFREIGTALGLSHQRVKQLVDS